jgi:hypothetical protein
MVQPYSYLVSNDPAEQPIQLCIGRIFGVGLPPLAILATSYVGDGFDETFEFQPRQMVEHLGELASGIVGQAIDSLNAISACRKAVSAIVPLLRACAPCFNAPTLKYKARPLRSHLLVNSLMSDGWRVMTRRSGGCSGSFFTFERLQT